MNQPVGVCAACGGPMTVTSMNALGTSWSCPCGRSTLTVLADGRLDLPVKPVTKEVG